MKKFFLMLLALMLALTTLTAFAEEDGPSAEANELADVVLLDGFITDVLDDSLLLLTKDGLAVEALLNEDTIFEGKNAAIGDYVQIVYNGIMTRSLPAKITAMAVRNHMLMGVVSDLAETGFTLTFGEEIYQVSADAALLEGIQDGMFITLYYNGMMTRMIPAGVTAMHIRGQEIVGTITEMVEGGFTLTVEGEEIPYHVGIKDGAFQFVQPEPGVEVIVITDGLETASLESILVNATEILPMPTAQEVFDLAGTVTEIGVDFILFENADGQLVQANLSADTVFEGKTIEAGDFIHVTYNGQMTFSLPGQISAMRVGCYAFTGAVDEIAEGSFLLKSEMDILVKATAAQLENLRAGQTVTVYSNGIMTASLPGQITAEMIAAAETIAD